MGVPAQEFRRLVPQHPGGRGIYEGVVPGLVQAHDPLSGRMENGFKQAVQPVDPFLGQAVLQNPQATVDITLAIPQRRGKQAKIHRGPILPQSLNLDPADGFALQGALQEILQFFPSFRGDMFHLLAEHLMPLPAKDALG
jgi:hypothetical protein